MTGSPSIPDPVWLPKSPSQRLADNAASRRDFSRIDPLDRVGLAAIAAARHAPADPALIAARLADFTRMPAVQTFAAGDLALRQTLSALLGPGDEVIVDAGAERAMFETVLQVSAGLNRCPSGSVEAVERRLFRLSRSPRKGRIFVLVPAVTRLSSVVADLAELARLCAHFGAVLVVDMTQDLGTVGPMGLGIAELQGCLSQIDVVLGDLSVTCGIAGGFAAFRDPALCDRIGGGGTTHSPSPDAAAMILAMLDMIDSGEGRHRRRLLHRASLRLRNHLMGDHVPIMGHPSPVVPVRLLSATARELAALISLAGLKLPLVEAPDVAGHAPRWLIRLTAGHGPADIDDLAGVLHDVIRAGARPRQVTIA